MGAPLSPAPASGVPDSISRARTPDSAVQPSKIPLPPSRQPSTAPSLLVTPTDKSTNSPPRTAAQEQAAQSRAKWAIENENERRVLQRQRSQLEMQREAEAEQQALFDAERSARLKYEREEAMRAEMDEDDRRKAVEQEHARRLAADRAAEEQRRRDEVAQKKAMEAQKRREEVAARIKREKEAELERERLALEKQKEEEAALASKREIQQQFTNLRSTGAVMLTGAWVAVLFLTNIMLRWSFSLGNVTTQAHDSLVSSMPVFHWGMHADVTPWQYWRRRYFELSSQGLAFYKSSDVGVTYWNLLNIHTEASIQIRLWPTDSICCLWKAEHERLLKSMTSCRAFPVLLPSSSTTAPCSCSSAILRMIKNC